MAILASMKHGPILRILVATGLGAAFGFQGWRLAQEGFPVPMPWYGALWVVLRHVALGLALGLTGASVSWWKRGIGLGTLFSIPSVVALYVMNAQWPRIACELCGGSMAAGILIAFLVDTICPNATSASTAERPATHPHDDSAASLRLAAAKHAIERIDAERQRRGDPAFGKAEEERIVWRELIDLELQGVDGHVDHLHGETS